MHILTLQDILPITSDKAAVINVVKQGFINHSAGKVSIPPPMQMVFKQDSNIIKGDCHIKSAYSDEHPYFSVKLATGFYENEKLNKPVNNGLLVLLSSETGEPLALFQDEGHITSVRTAAAGALAVELLTGEPPVNLGIIGTGHQAALQARWIVAHTRVKHIVIWGRNEVAAKKLQRRLQDLEVSISVASSPSELCKQSQVIVTTTPSTTPVLLNSDIVCGNSIVAIGSDDPEKNELDATIFSRASQVFTDDHNQCIRNGDFGIAVRKNQIKDTADASFGAALAHPASVNRSNDAINIVDLTGLGIQDLAVASLVWNAYKRRVKL